MQVVAIALALVAGAVVGYAVGRALCRRRSGRDDAAGAAVAEVDGVPAAVDAMLEVLPSTVLVLGPGEQVLRATPEAYVGGLVRGDLVADADVAALTRAVRLDGAARQLDLEVPRGDGQPRRLGLRAARIPGSGGRFVVLVLVQDRTVAARMDEMRRDFVANVSHELKTPVGAIALLGEALGEASEDPESVRRFAARIGRESVRLTELVQQITELSRLQYDDPLEAPGAVSVDDVVCDAVDRVRVDAAAKRITIASGGDSGCHVLGSRRQLVVALGNLVENAVAYSTSGGRVAVGVRRREEAVDISVTDQGIGIPEPELGRIFERFYRLDPARSRNTGGSGLGLSIVKHVAAGHGGEVNAWSVEGIGSTFTLRLPLLRSPAVPRAPYAVVPEASE